MLYNDMSKEQKKAFDKIPFIIALIVIIISMAYTGITDALFSKEYKIEKIFKKEFKYPTITTYNDMYLIVDIADSFVNEKISLVKTRNIIRDLSRLELENAILVIRFYDMEGFDKKILYQGAIGMSNVYNVDWTKGISYDDFKKYINFD